MKLKRWYRLDNAAKIFPPTTDQYDTKTFRFAVSLTEEVNADYLQKALEETLKNYPIFHSTLKKGIFWYYLEESDAKPIVSKEEQIPCDFMYGLLYRVSYYKKRISLEVSHALSDATGSLAFLKNLVTNYLKIKYHIQEIFVLDTASEAEKSDDSFEKYFAGSKLHKKKIEKMSYKVKGIDYPENRIKIIEGLVNTDKVHALAKKHNTTITIYLTSVLIDSIGKQMSMREKRKPVYITVPVNLRKYFPSQTIRNFFNTISISYKFKENSDFDDILKNVAEQFKKNLTKKELAYHMSDLVVLEKVFVLRVIPRFIKDFVLKLSYNVTRKMHTMTLSNIGVIEMPESLKKYIEYFDVFASTDGIQACMCSFEQNMMISFTSHFVNSEIEKNFFRALREKNIEVSIQTNILEEEEKL